MVCGLDTHTASGRMGVSPDAAAAAGCL